MNPGAGANTASAYRPRDVVNAPAIKQRIRERSAARGDSEEILAAFLLVFTAMTAQLIDGNALSRQLRAEVAQRATALKARGTTPGMAVVLVGDNPASQVYVRNKVKACEDAGFHSVLEKYDASMTEAELLARVEALNNDPAIHGILVQLPLPAHIDDRSTLSRWMPARVGR